MHRAVSAPFAPSSARSATRALLAGLAGLAASTIVGCAGRLPAPARPTVPAAPSVPAVVLDADEAAYLRGRDLLLPVAGVRARALRSSFAAPRDGGARTHQGIDILAPRGTPVLAADDGRVWTVRSNSLGGLTVYTVDPADRFVFYYAHLDRYRDGLADGMPLLKGDTLGFVGTTGNAPPDTPHLHFQVSRIGPDRHWWTAAPLDPLPYLRDAEVALAGRGERIRAATTGATTAAAAPTTPATITGTAAPREADAPGAIVVPAIRSRRLTQTVPADSVLPDTARRAPRTH